MKAIAELGRHAFNKKSQGVINGIHAVYMSSMARAVTLRLFHIVSIHYCEVLKEQFLWMRPVYNQIENIT